jgi:sugar O-acyltransferase (sialic acid O-acetyltransferase NeuD family)
LTSQLLIVGAGGLAREMAQLARVLAIVGSDEPIQVDDTVETSMLESIAEVGFTGVIVLGIGHPTRRLAAWQLWSAATRPANWPALIHPRADVGDTTTIGEGSVVTSGVVTTTHVTVGRGVLLNLNVTVGHNAVIGDCCVVNPGATISGGVTLGEGVLVGTGANILEGLTVGSGATVGAGAVVSRDVAPGDVVVGVPARSRGSE